MADSRSRLSSSVEGVIVLAVILVLVHTFVQDLALVLGWSWNTRLVLFIVGFGFDVFFTVEFLVRMYYAVMNRAAGRYFGRERGWIDFLASVPLVVLYSGPIMLALAVGGADLVGMGGMLGTFSASYAIRTARVLRLLRVLKVFHALKGTRAHMTYRHMANVATIGVSVIVLTVIALVAFSGAAGLPALESQEQARHVRTASLIDSRDLARSDRQELLRDVAASRPSVLVVSEGGATRYSRHDNEYYEKHFGMGDYAYVKSGATEIFFDLRPLKANQARQNMAYLVIVVIFTAAIALFYRRHFAATVTDPIHVMERGFSEHAHSLEVRIPERYRTDDIFRLAALYNSVYLPLKDRKADASGAGDVDAAGMADLSVSDLDDIGGEDE